MNKKLAKVRKAHQAWVKNQVPEKNKPLYDAWLVAMREFERN